MTTKIVFKGISDGRVVHRTIPIEHPDFDIIPSETFLGHKLPSQSIQSQVIDYLDSIDKSEIMIKYGLDLILDYYPKKVTKHKKRVTEVEAFIEYMHPIIEEHPDLQRPIEAVMSEAKDVLFGCGKTNIQKAKETLTMLRVSYLAATGAYKSIGSIYERLRLTQIE